MNCHAGLRPAGTSADTTIHPPTNTDAILALARRAKGRDPMSESPGMSAGVVSVTRVSMSHTQNAAIAAVVVKTGHGDRGASFANIAVAARPARATINTSMCPV